MRSAASNVVSLLVLACASQVQSYRLEAPKGTLEELEADMLKHEVEAEAVAVEKQLETVGDVLAKVPVDMKPVKGSFQVGDSLDSLELTKKATISMWRDTPVEGALPYIEITLTAKDAAAGDKFVSLLNATLTEFGVGDHLASATSQGGEVTLTTKPMVPSNQSNESGEFNATWETFARHFHHVEYTLESADVDMVGLLKNHSDTLVLKEMYKGFKTSVDAAFTSGLPDFFLGHNPLYNLFRGLNFDVRVGYNDTALEKVLEHTPGLDMTAAKEIETYRNFGEGIPVQMRGLPMAVKSLDILQAADDYLAALNSIEIKDGPQGFRAAVRFQHLNPFAIYNTLMKESGLDKILRNETTPKL